MVDLKSIFRNGDVVTRLIFVNVAVFAVVNLLLITLRLFNVPNDMVLPYLAMPADVLRFLMRCWTLVSYMFLHTSMMHLFFNMLCLYWFGKIALTYLNSKQVLGLYLWGGVMAGAAYLVSYNIFPYYASMVDQSMLLGASGSIMAIMVAAAMLAPNMKVRFLLIGAVRLKYVAMVTVLVSLFGITGTNAGGELAHLGGALAGYLFVVLWRQGRDVTGFFSGLVDSMASLFDRKPRTKKHKPKFHYQAPTSDGDYNQRKAKRSADVDAILDKIKRSGYDSLSAEEKRKLFEK